MNLPDIPLLGMLQQRMNWLNARQGVLSQNIANADSPGYAARDMKPLDFESLMHNASDQTLRTTSPMHISRPASGGDQPESTQSADTESNPTGNTVSLEQEMIKVADNQMQYQTATNLYSKMMSMMRTAIGQP